MTLSRSSVLFYNDFATGPEAEVGGQLSFSRDSEKWTLGRDGLYHRARAGQVAYEWTDLTGKVGQPPDRRPGLLVEGSVTPLTVDSADLNYNTSSWSQADSFTSEASAPSIFGPDFSAFRVVSNGSQGRTYQTGFTSNGQKWTGVAILEHISGSFSSNIRLKDNTASLNVQGGIAWDTEATLNSGADEVRLQKLSDHGPHGGRVYKLIVTHAYASGDALTMYVHPFVSSTAGDEIVMHYAHFVDLAVPSGVVPFEGSAVSRAADIMEFSPHPDPQDMAIYAEFVSRTVRQWDASNGSHPDGSILDLGTGSGTGTSRLHIRSSPDVPDFDNSNYFFQHNDTANGWHTSGHNFGRAIDGLVQMAAIFRPSTEEMRLVGRANGGGASSGGFVATGTVGGWGAGATLGLGTDFGSSSFDAWHRLYMVRLADIDAPLTGGGTNDDTLMDELADYHLRGP